MSKIDWSELPEELVDFIADRLSSNIDLIHIRSICKPWRSAVAMKKRFQNRFQRNLASLRDKKHTCLFPTTFFRVTLPSSCSSSKGWLIRTRQVSESSKNNLLSPLSRKLITSSNQTLDLLKYSVSEIYQSFEIQYLESQEILSSRVVFIDNMFFAIEKDTKIRCFKGGEERKKWTRIKDVWGKDKVKGFSDIILHRGHIYALDKNGAIWWISLSQLSTVQYTPSTPLDYYGIESCREKRLVEYCGDLCIVHRFCKNCGVEGAERTIGFKVYKMDEDLAKWVNVSSLGDKAFIVAVDSCFTVVASEYYGCLANSIYFTDSDEENFIKGMKVECVKVFKLEDESIIYMNNYQSCFDMFSPPFL